MSDESLQIEKVKKNEISTITNHLSQASSEPTKALNQQISADSSKHTKVVLPEEIITDIISRMPAKPVFQIQCLSKNFSSITKDNHFIGAHLRHSARLHPSIIFTSKFNSYLIRSSTFDSKIILEEVPLREISNLTDSSKQIVVVGSCNGLVVAEVVGPYNVFNCLILLNPATRKCSYLPMPTGLPYKILTSSWGFGYCAESKVYKVVRVGFGFCSSGSTKLVAEVLTYGTDCIWRKLEFSRLDGMRFGNGITISGVVYFRPTYGYNKLLIFSLEKEEFALISCPFSMDRGEIMEFRGLIAACIESEFKKQRFDIWVLKNMEHFDYSVSNTENESHWEKLYTNEIFPGKPLFCLNDRYLLMHNQRCLFGIPYSLYDMKCKEMKKSFHLFCDKLFEAFNFVESIVPIPASGIVA